MLFWIDPSIASLFATGTPSPGDMQCLDYFAIGIAEGNHRVVGSRLTLRSLADQTTLSRRIRDVFQRAANKASQEGNLHHKLVCYGIVTASTSSTPVSSTRSSQRIITFPLSWFDCSSKVQPTVLLCENLSDCNVFQIIGEVATVLSALTHIPIKAFNAHGGGSTIAQVLRSYLPNRFCICFVDSDRASPSSILSGTPLTVQTFKDSTLYPLIAVTETLGRDLENLLPLRFYIESYRNDPLKKAMSDLLKSLTTHGEEDLRFHIDIEKGVSLNHIYKYAPGSTERIFWDIKIPTLLALCTIPSTTFPCLTSGICANSSSGNPCTCTIITGNTANILNDFYACFQHSNRYALAKYLDQMITPEWLRLGHIIASWCCGETRLRN